MLNCPSHEHHDVYPHCEQVFKTVPPDPSHLKDYQPNPTGVWMTLTFHVPVKQNKPVDSNNHEAKD